MSAQGSLKDKVRNKTHGTVVVITQANWVEGKIAAWVAKKFIGDKMLWFDFDGELPEAEGVDILCLGIGFSAANMKLLISRNNSVTVLDNDMLTRNAIGGMKNVKISLNQTPARMAWQYFGGDREPWLIDYTEDSRLWRYGANKIFVKAFMDSRKLDFEEMDKISKMDLCTIESQGIEIAQKVFNSPVEAKKPKEITDGHQEPGVTGSNGADIQPAEQQSDRSGRIHDNAPRRKRGKNKPRNSNKKLSPVGHDAVE